VTRQSWALFLTLLALIGFVIAAVLSSLEDAPVAATVGYILAATASAVSVLLQLSARRRAKRKSSDA
jgi:hypothetical protein